MIAGSEPGRTPTADGEALDVVHLDMDSFFASVEVQCNPALRNRPVVVGGTGARGVVASASYEARVFGIHSAMPTALARGLCPNAVFVPGNFDLYGEISGQLHEILRAATPLVEPVALDEAYLDLVGAHRLLGSSPEIATALRRDVEQKLGLDCAVGVGRTKLIAKLASKAAKPRIVDQKVHPGAGVVVVGGSDELRFLHAHPVRALPGVGPRTAERLKRFGVSTVGDLAGVHPASLHRLLGASHGGSLHELAWGRDERPVVAERAARSIGHEETFPQDIRRVAELNRKLRDSAAIVALRCRSGRVEARTVTVKVRYGDFTTVTRARTLAQPVASAAAIGDAAVELVSTLPVHDGVRLVGVHCSMLTEVDVNQSEQLELFSPDADVRPSQSVRVRDEVEAATEAIRRRYGDTAIASLGSQRAKSHRSSPAGPVEGG